MMQTHILFWGALLSFLPISELRGAIPFLLANKATVPFAYLYCVVLNALVAPIAYIFLSSVHKLLERIPAYHDFFARFVEKTRNKVKPEVDKFGFLGLMIFVAIPLPMTGAWSGTLGAWILGMDRKKSILSVAAGVAIAGLIVTAVAWSGIGALNFLLKKV
jgi:uncharacterized membrane protein